MAEEQKVRKCKMKDMLPASIIPIIAAAPHNNTVRALLLAHLKQEPPKDCVTYQQIVDWVEFNFEKPEDPVARILREEQQRLREQEERRSREEEQRERESMRIRVIASDHEYGSARYSMDIRGEGDVPLHKPTLLQFAADNSTAQDFWDSVEEAVRDDAQNRVSMDPVQASINLSDHDDIETDGICVEFPEATKEVIKEFIRTEAPERYRQLFGQ